MSRGPPIHQKMSNRKKKTSADKENDEVEELLRAAEEDVLLKMNLNSHTLRGSSSRIIPSDLDRRFQALKSKHQNPSTKPQIQQINTTTNHHDDGDLLGRFEALKKSLPSHQKQSNVEISSVGDECEEEEDEVEKLIKWAMDAARLDPSPPSDTEEGEQEQQGSDDDSDDDSVKKPKKGKSGKRK